MWIIVDEGPDHGKSLEIRDGTFTIGRSSDSSLVLSDEEASSHHATIETVDGRSTLRDLNSTNGTVVNGVRIAGEIPVPMSGDERLTIGQSKLHLSRRSPDATVIHRDPPMVAAAVPAPAPLAAKPATPATPAAGAAPAEAAPFAPRGYGSSSSGQKRTGLLVGGAVAVLIVVGAVVAFLATRSGNPTLTPQQVIAQATPSVVRIQGDQGAGSGIIIDAKRQLVLTNAHVVVGNTALTAQIGNSTSQTSPLQVVAADPCDDLAVLKLVDPIPNLKAVTFGDSSTLQPGSEVTVLGFPGSLQQSEINDETIGQATTVVANTGTVSQINIKATPDPGLPEYQSTIVHQAPVNHGDSGGPLLNSHGRVVGINTLSNTENQGQYYAIAIDYIKRLLPALEAGQSRGLIGWDLTPVSAADSSLEQELYNLYSSLPLYAHQAKLYAEVVTRFIVGHNISGMFDLSDQPGSAAATANTAGYLITDINGDPVSSVSGVCNVIQSVAGGNQVKLSGINIAGGNPREVGQPLDATVTIPSH